MQSRTSRCGTFTVVIEHYNVPLYDRENATVTSGGGFLPMDRRCTNGVYYDRKMFGKKTKGAVLLIPGFASNREMFDLGGGRGKSGPSFAEFLAKHGYDTFAIDLRGTQEALGLGARRPACLREYVEIDIPSAIDVIKRIGPYEKVYLIGHSMGGALSCAVAGLHPNDVAGVVHLAGLYHFTLPFVGELFDFYRTYCPKVIKTILRDSTGLAFRSASSLFSPFITCLSDPTLNCPTVPSGAVLDLASEKRHILLHVSNFITHLKRQPIPFRTGLEVALFLRRFVPARIEKAIMNVLYPSPWLPNSVEDPFGLLKASVESPTVGVYLSLARMAIHHEYYNNWVMSSSNHHAEAAEAEAAKEEAQSAAGLAEIFDASKNIVEGRKQSGGGEASPEVIDQAKDMLEEWEQAMKDYAGAAAAEADHASAAAAADFATPASAEGGEAGEGVEDEFLRRGSVTSVASDVSTRSTAATSSATTTATRTTKSAASTSGDGWVTWNELAPYFLKFEKLEHLPLFFCYANADKVLRLKDTMAGYDQSKSRWKEVIEYATVAGRPKKRSERGKRKGGKIEGKVGEEVKKVVEEAVKKVVEEKKEQEEKKMEKEREEASASASAGAGTDAGSSSAPVPPPSSPTPSRRRGVPASMMFTPIEEIEEWIPHLPSRKKSMSSACLSLLPASVANGGPPSPSIAPAVSTTSPSSYMQPHTTSTQLASPTASSWGSDAEEEDASDPSPSPVQPHSSKSRSSKTDARLPFTRRYSIPPSYSYGHVDILGGVHAERMWGVIVEWLDATSAREKDWKFKRRYSAK
ncbi:hypothetical protein HK104_000855 [Borealophlyctis nickersoniae]|nr:hypothetical protein HK104_000855 [Borealophlyctis nickersoniae]